MEPNTARKEMIGKRGKFSGVSEKQLALKLRWRRVGDFQRRLPATGNARSPTSVDSCVRRITNCEDDDDRRRQRLESATFWM